MAGPRGRGLSLLWEPHASVQGGLARRKASLAAGLLAALLPLGVLALLFPAGGFQAPYGGRAITIFVLCGLALAYAVVRRGHVKTGVLVAIASIELSLGASALVATDRVNALLALALLSVPIVFAGVLLPVRAAASVAILTVALCKVLEARIIGTWFGLPALLLALMLAAVAVLAMAASALLDRQMRELDDSARLLGRIGEAIPDAFFILSSDRRRLLYASQAYESVMGRSIQQGMADPFDWVEAVHPDDRDAVRKRLREAPASMAYRVVHPSGEVRHVEGHTYEVRDAGGRVTQVVGVVEDVTASVEAQGRLREAQAQRLRLLQQLAHDLASPLSPLRIQLRLLEGRVDEKGKANLAVVARNVAHLQRLVEDVKDLARLEGGAFRLERRATDLAALAREAAETLAPVAAERQVTVQVAGEAALPVEADPGRMTQVLYNLVGNALKFTPPGGVVEARVTRSEGWGEVAVRDSGAGMRADQLAGLFQPFSQVHDPGTVKRPEDKGTGLGLYISKGIVEAHGGGIRADSAGPGAGSTFTFRLPLRGPDGAA